MNLGRISLLGVSLFGFALSFPVVSALETKASEPSVGQARPTISVGHTREIVGATLSPEGRRLFTYDDANIRVWDVESGRELKLLRSYDGGHSIEETPWAITFDEDRKWILIGHRSEIVVFNYESLEPIAEVDKNVVSILWDRPTKKLVAVPKFGSGDSVDICELVLENNKLRAVDRLEIKIERASDTKTKVTGALVSLGEGRVLAAPLGASVMIDLRDWTAQMPNQKPTIAKATVSTEPISLYTFHPAPEDRHYFAGPNGAVMNWVYYPWEQKKVGLELVSPKDLAITKSAVISAEDFVFLDRPAFDAKHNLVWFPGTKHLYGVDPATLETKDTVSLIPLYGAELVGDEAIAFLTPPASDRWLLVGKNSLWNYELERKRVGAMFGERIFASLRIATHPTNFEFLVTDQHRAVKQVRILPNGLEVTEAQKESTAIAYDPSGDSVVQGEMHVGVVYLSDAATWNKNFVRMPNTGGYNNTSTGDLAFSDDGSLLAIQSFAGVAIVSLQDGKEVVDASFPNHYSQPNRTNHVAISPDNHWAVALKEEDTLIGLDLEAKKVIWEKKYPEKCGLLYFVSNDTFCCLRGRGVVYNAADTGATLVDAPLDTFVVPGAPWAISKDKKLIAEGALTLKVFDAVTGAKRFEHKVDSFVNNLAFFADPRFLLTVSDDNLIRLWNLEKGAEVATLAIFSSNNEWVVSSPDLRFDASPKAIDKMYVVRGADIIPLESLFDKLYTPKLAAALVAGEDLAPPSVDLKNLHKPPVVRLELADGTRNLSVEDDTPGPETTSEDLNLRATADAPESALAEIRLFQNGKLLNVSAVEAAHQTQSFQAKLVPGLNTFRAVAINADRTESVPSELVVNYKGKPTSPTATAAEKSGGIQLHLLVVGVNSYQNSKYNLNYAVADATAVRDQIEQQTKSIFTAANVTFILDEKASKAAILEAFRTISAKAGPRDVFVFYYAGHGVMSTDAHPEFFLVPHDVVQLYGADDALRQKGISSTELRELSQRMPAQKQLFILDACQSAGALKTVAMRGAAEEKAIAQLARATGTHWLTASGSEQFATEFAQLHHGAFTYALIEGLGGKADETGDGRVTVNELKAYLETQVPELTQKYKGTPQYPSSYGFGQDFPVAVITK